MFLEWSTTQTTHNYSFFVRSFQILIEWKLQENRSVRKEARQTGEKIYEKSFPINENECVTVLADSLIEKKNHNIFLSVTAWIW